MKDKPAGCLLDDRIQKFCTRERECDYYAWDMLLNVSYYVERKMRNEGKFR